MPATNGPGPDRSAPRTAVLVSDDRNRGGRPSPFPGVVTVPRTVRLPEEVWAELLRRGEGSYSLGIAMVASAKAPAAMPDDVPVLAREVTIAPDASGCVRLTFAPPNGEPEHSALLMPEAVTFLVDALSGMAPAAQGEARIVARVSAVALADALVRYHRGMA